MSGFPRRGKVRLEPVGWLALLLRETSGRPLTWGDGPREARAIDELRGAAAFSRDPLERFVIHGSLYNYHKKKISYPFLFANLGRGFIQCNNYLINKWVQFIHYWVIG